MLLLLDVMCAAGVLFSAVLIGGLLAGTRLLPTAVAIIVTMVLVLPGFTAGVITNRRTVRGRQPQSGWVRSVWSPPELPRWGIVVTGLVFLAFWAAGMSAFTGLSQDDLPPGDTAAQERQVSHQQRFGLGVLGGIGTGGTALAAGALVRNRRSVRTGERQMAAR
ncbi:hypothetical protein AFR_30060 [Actinoplanes friuliensis DSM 7358]|uniref:Uncharacterized protein n=2 Tax=Actinoplanes friuliensis TaxID=196914 RepID=U5W5I7_9ACTN|nr:hypothetical protein AFR_30060 [Actinoplanes friuliensis DSM 7358]